MKSDSTTIWAGGRTLGAFVWGPSTEAAVVVTVTANADAVPFTPTELGETEQVDSASASPQVSVTVPLNPLIGEIWRS